MTSNYTLDNYDLDLFVYTCAACEVVEKLARAESNGHPFHSSIGFGNRGDKKLILPPSALERHLAIASPDQHYVTDGEQDYIRKTLIDCWDHITRFQPDHGATKVQVNCQEGISRSVGLAIFLQCAARSSLPPEVVIERMLLRLGKNPSPNMPIICAGDALLGLEGKLVQAVEQHQKFRPNLMEAGWFGQRDHVSLKPSQFHRRASQFFGSGLRGGD
jgi:predicted protein tyrosine phosphatase